MARRRSSWRLPQTPRRPRAASRPRVSGRGWSWAGLAAALAGALFVYAQRGELPSLDRFAGQVERFTRTAEARAGLPETAVVARVVDGDTVELDSGEKLRYIGVDTPETHRREGSHWVTVHEAYGREAEAFNRRLVEGQAVRLEFDVQPRDKYGRLLAYVYVGEMFVNAELLRHGYAHQLTIPPNVRHAETFEHLVREAREARRGLWESDTRHGAAANR